MGYSGYHINTIASPLAKLGRIGLYVSDIIFSRKTLIDFHKDVRIASQVQTQFQVVLDMFLFPTAAS